MWTSPAVQMRDSGRRWIRQSRLRACWESGHCQGLRPGAGTSRRVMSPIMAHLTQASECSGRRSYSSHVVGITAVSCPTSLRFSRHEESLRSPVGLAATRTGLPKTIA